MQQAQARGGMDVATVVAGAAHMQMKMTMLGGTIVAVLMGVQFQPERRAHGQSTHHQQGHTHQKFRPRRHGLHVGQVFQTNGDQRQNHNSGGVTNAPSQGVTKGGPWLAQGEGRHCHQVISTTHHMNGPGCHTGQKANQHKEPPECRNSASAVKEELP
eukprot:TRINITY_DN13398_c0_g1_i1.p2 TRINITY_DN13398_c0_g1~~TRINITY_DN13398_c0_g1_i1.p2  ORF type:complete len:158 (+),score=22.64 TRINITY_DN13398_c0_g1_i1:196-669(+)